MNEPIEPSPDAGLCVLVVFAKDPERGKSRLAAGIGRARASQVARALLVDTLQAARAAAESSGVRVSLAAADSGADAALARYGADFTREPQVGQTLGERLRHCVESWRQRGASRVVVVGTDCPFFSGEEVAAAMDRLTLADVVLGPASDGGYYLIGLRTDADSSALFDGIDWGTPAVLEQTVAAVRSQRLTLRLLPQLPDVDRADDLQPVFGLLEAAHTAWQVRGQATYWTLFDLLARLRREDQAADKWPPFEHVRLPELPGIDCPCGVARRAFGAAADFPGTVHWTQVSLDAEPHFHDRQTEVYVVVACGDDAAIELDGQRQPVAVGDAVLIRPGCVHRAIGAMTVVIVCVPKFDPADEVVVSRTD